MPGRLRLVPLVAVVLATLALPAGAAASRLRVGGVTLHRCADSPRAWCGSVARPLDVARAGGPRIRIGLRWLPAARPGAGLPPLVAVEGGPGYPSTGSRVEYTGIYGPLLRDRDLLLVDNRGTGTSALIDCRALQRSTAPATGDAFAAGVAACGREIDRAYPGVRGAADLFGTAYAVADLAAVLRRLRLPDIDLYGDSYGTWFVQAFMARHPELLHSVVLDSAYPVRDLDPWYASSGEAARRALDAVCTRDPGCAAATAGAGTTATDRIGQLLARLRTAPIGGVTRDADGSAVRAHVGVAEVADLVQDAGSDPVIDRELDASVRAALAGDDVPLLRLVAQSRTWDHGTSTADYFSDGLYMTVSCTDYPQLFSMSAAPAQRRARLAARLADPPASAFAPFTAAEWLTISNYSQPYTACLDWRAPVHRAPLLPRADVPLPATVPLLVLGGDLDSLTPLADAAAMAPRLGRTVRVVELPNTVHVTSEGDTMLSVSAACARTVIRSFVRRPWDPRQLATRCAARIPPVHTPGAYPLRVADAAPATLVAGADPGDAARRAVTVAAGAVADATIRRFYSGSTRGPGLRGGRFTVSEGGTLRLRLRAIRHTADASVDGSATWRPATGAVRATLTVRPDGGAAVPVTLAWDQADTQATARVGAATLALPAP